MSKLFPTAEVTPKVESSSFVDAITTGSNYEFCRAHSLVDYWSVEDDLFYLKIPATIQSQSWAACSRITDTLGKTINFNFQVCHGAISEMIAPNMTVTVPFQYTRCKGKGGWNPYLGLPEFDPKPHKISPNSGIAHWTTATEMPSVPFEDIRSFYYWITSKRNPIWVSLLDCIDNVVIHRESNIHYGVSFRIHVPDLILIKQFLMQTRFLSERYITDVARHRRLTVNRLRSTPKVPWAAIMVVGESTRLSAHNFLKVDECTFYNFMTNRRMNSMYVNESYNREVPPEYQVSQIELSSMTNHNILTLLTSWKENKCPLLS